MNTVFDQCKNGKWVISTMIDVMPCDEWEACKKGKKTSLVTNENAMYKDKYKQAWAELCQALAHIKLVFK